MQINKIKKDMTEILSDVFDGATIMVGGFGEAGSPIELLHGLIVNHSIIKQNKFEVIWNKNELNYSINKNKFQSDCEKVLFDWLKKENLDIKKLQLKET